MNNPAECYEPLTCQMVVYADETDVTTASLCILPAGHDGLCTSQPTMESISKGTTTKLNNVYPSIEELIPPVMKARLPHTLVEEIEERYLSLGEKYMTKEQHFDGRFYNGMMLTDRIANCREEIVDAAFCILGQIFKEHRYSGQEPDDRLYILLMGIQEIYSSLKIMEYEGEYPVEVRPVF